MDCSPPGSSVHGILQARILEWVAISFSRGSFWPRDRNCVSCIAGGFFTTEQVSPYCTQAQRIIKQVPLLLPVRPRNRTLLHQRCSAHPSFINTLSRTHPAPHIASSCHVRFFQSVAVPYLSQPWIFPLAMPHGMWDLPRSGIKPAPPAAQVWSFVNHWTTKEVHSLDSFKAYRPLTL